MPMVRAAISTNRANYGDGFGGWGVPSEELSQQISADNRQEIMERVNNGKRAMAPN